MLPGLTSAILAAGGGIQFVGGATASKAGATSGTSTIPLNSGLTGGIASAVSDGDLVIAAFATASVGRDSTLAITGYTLIGSELWSDDSYDTNLRVAYKFVSGDTATTFGATGDVDDAGAMAVYVFRGVDATTPLDVTVTTATAGNSVLANPPSITPTSAGAYIVCVGAGAHNDEGQTFTSSDLTDFLTVAGDDTNSVTLGIGHKPDWTSGAFDASAFGFTGSSSTSYSWAAMSIALRPA